jgi:hypothetical protein
MDVYIAKAKLEERTVIVVRELVECTVHSKKYYDLPTGKPFLLLNRFQDLQAEKDLVNKAKLTSLRYQEHIHV